jgi:hypothetical protein
MLGSRPTAPTRRWMLQGRCALLCHDFRPPARRPAWSRRRDDAPIRHWRKMTLCESGSVIPRGPSNFTFLYCGLATWRRFDVRPIPSATRPSESVLPIRLRPDFLGLLEG